MNTLFARPKAYRKMRLALVLGVGRSSASCSLFAEHHPKTVAETKVDMACSEYRPNLPWQEVKTALGKPEYPPTEPGQDFSKNARVYENSTIIYYVEPDQNKMGEVITKLEVCREQ